MVAREEDQARPQEWTAGMSASEAANQGTGPVKAGHGFDPQRLAGWMAAHVPGYAGPMTVEQFKGGQSNPTYKLTTPGRSYVLRRKPPGDLVKGAHAIEREVEILTALARSGFPVARIHGLCGDASIVGTTFYVMEHVEGRVFWDATLPSVPRPERARYFDAMNAAIAQLHGFDYEAAGLAGFGKPGNYFHRQIARWSQQYVEDRDAGANQDMDVVIDWLRENIPAEDETTVIHGDYRCDNIIFHPTEPRILAVLDWELSTLGHPLADFTYHAMMYRTPPDIVAGLKGANLVALGLPSESDYTQAYCDRTGRRSIPHYEFYMAFNFFRLAAIFHGIKGRVIRGTAASAHAAERAKAFPALAALARQSMERMR